MRFGTMESSLRMNEPSIYTPVWGYLDFPCGWAGKESACNVGDLGSIPGLGRSPGEGKVYPLQYSGLENSMDSIVLLLLSRFSCVRLCATLSLGFSRQEHEWVAIAFSNAWKWSRSVMSDSSRPYGLQPTRLLHPWDFPGKSTGVGCHCLLRNIVHGIATSQTRLSNFPLWGFYPWIGKIPWRRWQPTPVFLPAESRGQRNLATGQCLKGLDMIEQLSLWNGSL